MILTIFLLFRACSVFLYVRSALFANRENFTLHTQSKSKTVKPIVYILTI
jgi:hypothetical protein